MQIRRQKKSPIQFALVLGIRYTVTKKNADQIVNINNWDTNINFCKHFSLKCPKNYNLC